MKELVAQVRSGCCIYKPGGAIERLTTKRSVRQLAPDGIPTIAGMVPIVDIMSTDVICVDRALEVDKVVDLVLHYYIGCVPVVDADGAPLGMITKRDLVEELACLMRPTSTANSTPTAADLAPRVAEEIMLPLAFTLDEHATVAMACAMMTVEGVHHVPVVSETGVLIGLVSSLDVVRWLARNDRFVEDPATN